MHKRYLSALLICFILTNKTNAQNIYHKNVNMDTLRLFNDTIKNLTFVNNDSVDYTHHFKYVLRFFPRIEFENIKVIFKQSDIVARVKPTFLSALKSSEKRKYKIYFSNKCNSTLDSVILKKLKTNCQVGLIARQLGHIHDLSTDGFFDIIAWRVKQISRRAKKKMEHQNELELLDLGLGYQMLALRQYEEQKLLIEKWQNADAYAKWIRREKNKYMSPHILMEFIHDMPIYVIHRYLNN